MSNQDAIYGLFPDRERAEGAVRRLLREGVEEDAVELISPVPMEDPTLLPKRKKSWMPWLAVVGGLLGGLGATLLVTGTQRAYPIPTGKMPIVTTWANGVVVFELTMLGVIVTTLLVLLVSAGLGTRKPALYDPAVSDGKFLVAIVDPPVRDRSRLEDLLRQSGSDEIKSLAPEAVKVDSQE